MAKHTEWLEECGCCGAYHKASYHGDCRNDSERYYEPYLITREDDNV